MRQSIGVVLILISALLWVGGCAGDDLSLGELRCAGEAVECERPRSFQLEAPESALDLAASSRREAEVLWRADFPCPTGGCYTRGAAAILHADASVTVARAFEVSLEGEAYSHAGVWLGRYDADGELIWEDDSLVERVTGASLSRFDAALAQDAEGRALIAVLRHPSGAPDTDEVDEVDEVSVYRADGESKIKRLFRTEGFADLSAIEDLDGDVLLLGHHLSGRGVQIANPELARYKVNGELVWRQSALRDPGAGELPWIELLSPVDHDLPLVVDDEGRITLAVVEAVDEVCWFDTVRLGPDGNVRWGAGGHEASLGWPAALYWNARIVQDTEGRLVLGQGAYNVARLEPNAGASRRAIAIAHRERDAYWDTTLLGLAIDGSNRVLAATQSGTRTAPEYLVDRISPDFEDSETFVLPESLQQDTDGGFFTTGILAAADDTVVVWSESAIARVALH